MFKQIQSRVINLSLVLCITAFFVKGQNNSWNKVQTNQLNTLNITCFDTKGNYYISMIGVSEIAKANVYSGQIEFLSKPIINNIRVEDIRLLTGMHDQLYAILNGVAYTYENNIYESFLLPDGTVNKAPEPDYLYFNSLGNMFSVEFNSVFRFDTNWNRNSITELYNSGNSYLYAPSFYVPDTNFILEYALGGSKNRIINLNTNNGSSNIVLEFNTPINAGKFAILDRDGSFYIPTSQDLLCYKEFGQKFFTPDIDPDNRTGTIEAFTRGIVNKEFVIYKGSKFYISFDDCKTWMNTKKMNTNFPTGKVKKFVVWDSLHAITVVTDDCFYDHLYYLDPINKSWKNLYHENLDNLDLTEFGKYENGDFVSLINGCDWAVSTDQGSNWSLVPNIDKPGNNSGHINFIHTDKGDYNFFTDSLFVYLENGKTWQSIAKLPKRVQKKWYLGSGKFFIATDTLILNEPHYKYYISYDYGRTFTFKYLDLENKFDNSNFILDHNNYLLSYGGRNYKYFSKDDGQSWNPEARFKDKIISHLEFTNDGEYFMTTKINDIYGLYSTRDFVKYTNLSESLSPYNNITFNLIDDSQLVIATKDVNKNLNLFYSQDKGNTWQNINYDIDFKRPDDREASVNYFYLNEKNNLFMSLANDGLYKLTQTISTNEVANISSITIFPQPVDNFLNLSASVDLTGYQFKIFNLFGQELKSGKIINNQISIQTLPPGIYTLYLIGDLKNSWLRRFSKI